MLNRTRLVGAVPLLVPLHVADGEWRLDLDALPGTVTERTRVVFVNNASFPTGWVASEEEWDVIASLCRVRDLSLLYWGGYESVLFDGRSPLQPAGLPGMRDRTVTVGSTTLEQRMIGWRIGWVVAPGELANDVSRVHIYNGLVASGFGQIGARVAHELLDAEVFVKHENHQPVGAFKVRGGVNLVSQLNAEERERGVIAASTGNHGQSLAYAARLFGVEATICLPESANPVKVASMRGLGAELVFHGRDYDEAREHCEQLAREHGYRYVHSGNEPLLIAGVATETLEILEQQPQIDVIVVPIGGGSGAAGACI